METSNKKKNSVIKDRIKRLLESQKLADIHFLVGQPPNDLIIPSHKLILSLASPVFEDMFYGDNAIEDDLVNVPDIDAEAFKIMLEFIYSDRKKIGTFEQAMQVYYASKKYKLKNLMKVCINFLESRIKPSNACLAYEFAAYFKEENLMKSSLETIKTSTLEVLQNDNFLDISPETLMVILDQKKLNLKTELELFKAVQRYADARVYQEAVQSADQNEKDINNSNGIVVNLVHHIEHIKIEVDSSENREPGELDEGMSSAGSSFAATDNHGSECHIPESYEENLISSQPLSNTENIFNETEQIFFGSQRTMNNVTIPVQSSGSQIIPLPQKQSHYNLNHNGIMVENNKNKPTGSQVNGIDHILSAKRTPVSEETIRKAVKKIRFLTFTPQEFVRGPALSKLLKRDEAFAILVNIIEKSDECPMPEGFSLI